MPFFGKDDHFDRSKLSTALKMANSRMAMQRNKKDNLIKQQKREVATLLTNGKEESARIKIEAILRDQYMVEGMELLQLFLDLLGTRIQLVVEAKSCPTDMKEAISTIIWATPRVENVPELLQIRDQLSRKFGREFAQKASENAEGAVHQRTLFRLSMQVPEPYLCVQAMVAIAKEYQVNWEPKPDMGDPINGLGNGTGHLPDPVHVYPGGLPVGLQPTAPPPPQHPQHMSPPTSVGYIPAPPPFDPTGAGLPPPIFPGQQAPMAPPMPGVDHRGDMPHAKEAAPLPPPMPDYNPYGHPGGASAAGGPPLGVPGGLQAQQNADFLDLEARLNNLKRGNP